MSTYKLTIPHTPKAKASVRTGKWGGYYNPSCKGMNLTREHVKQALKDQPIKAPLNGPLLVIAHYRIPAPHALPQRKRVAQNNFPHTKKPDGDNLEKFLNDALNGVVWNDDSRISWLLRSKSITSEKVGETILIVKELSDGKPDYETILDTIKEHIRFDDDDS